MTMKYNAIRKTHWSAQKKKLKKEFGIDFKNSPYTFFKAAIYIEFSAIIVFFFTIKLYISQHDYQFLCFAWNNWWFFYCFK